MSPGGQRQSGGFDLGNYNEVSARIEEFRTKHPEGSLQQVCLDFREVNGSWWVIYTAAAYRFPDDPRPGHGTAWEPVPGKTPYTRDSEVQNAETAAWGRALIAVGAADAKKGIASADEVRSRQRSPEPPQDGACPACKGSKVRKMASGHEVPCPVCVGKEESAGSKDDGSGGASATPPLPADDSLTRRRAAANAALAEAGVKGDEERHAAIKDATAGQTESSKALTSEQLTLIKAWCDRKKASA